MKILIIEDEKIAADKIKAIVNRLIPEAEILDSIGTIDESVKFLTINQPDLIFMDIELADGTSFEIFNQVEIKCPIIFTTAYNKYAIKAFEVNSIDYLLKPISEEAIHKAILNYQRMRDAFSYDYLKATLSTLSSSFKESYKSSFLVKSANNLIPIKCQNVAYFFASDKWTYIITEGNQKYILNYTLSRLEELLDPNSFMRVNRSYLVNKESITKLEPYLKGQVVVSLLPDPKETVIVSRKHTPILKSWMGL